MWDPALYRQFGAERSRPFYELLGRIGATDPGFVADLGCGPGELTAELARRWPAADVLGVDSSAEMIAAADAVLAELRSARGDAEAAVRARRRQAVAARQAGRRHRVQRDVPVDRRAREPAAPPGQPAL